MRRKLDEPVQTRLDTVFDRAPDGAYHTRDGCGRASSLAAVSGCMLGVSLRPIRAVARGCRHGRSRNAEDHDGRSAPRSRKPLFLPLQRPADLCAPLDQLQPHRTAPADFDFQQAEFSVLGGGEQSRCQAALHQPADADYDDSGDTWTTGCMTPVRIDGRHVGAWGISIPLSQMIADLRAPPQGATIIVSDNGRLIHHSELSQGGDRALAANVELASSRIPMLRNIGRIIAGAVRARAHSPELDAYVIAEKLDAPDWYLLTVLPQRRSAQAWSIAKRVILVSAIGTLLLGLVRRPCSTVRSPRVSAGWRCGPTASRPRTGTMGPTDAVDEFADWSRHSRA